MTDKQMVQFWKTFAQVYNGPDNLDTFNAECKRFAALDVILLGHIQTLNWHERLFLGLLVKSLMKYYMYLLSGDERLAYQKTII